MRFSSKYDMLKVGVRVVVAQLLDEHGKKRPNITGIVYAVDYYDKKVSKRVTSFRMGMDDNEHTPPELMALFDYDTWEVNWVIRVYDQRPTVEELLTHRCGIIRSMGTRRMKAKKKK